MSLIRLLTSILTSIPDFESLTNFARIPHSVEKIGVALSPSTRSLLDEVIQHLDEVIRHPEEVIQPL